MNKYPLSVKISGSGTYLPGPPIPVTRVNEVLGDLPYAPKPVKRWMERISPLMQQLVEVESYHFAFDPATRQFTDDNVSMSVKACRIALEAAGKLPADVDLIVYGSAHQDQMPTASVRIQEKLGISSCAELSIHANCTSAYKALLLGADLIRNGRYRNALVVSSGISSSELRAEYYNQPLVKREEVFLRYFLSDGAAAVFLEGVEYSGEGFFMIRNYMESIGGSKPSAMGNKRPAYWMNPREEFDKGYHHLAQMFQDELSRNFHGPEGSVFIKGLKRMMESDPFDPGKIKYLQINFPSRHISELILDECEKIGIPRHRYYSEMNTEGYTGPPMALQCLDRIIREKATSPGDLILSFVTEVSKFMQAGYLVERR